MIRTLILAWPVEGRERKHFEFSSEFIRLNDDLKHDPYIGLTESEAAFDQGDDHTARTKMLAPKGLKKWVKFEAEEELPEGTSIGYRLLVNAGQDEIYHNGTEWVPATDMTHWNTNQQVCDKLAELTLVDYDLAILANLRTTDPAATPKIRRFKVVAEIDVEWIDDLIYDSVVRRLRQTLRATTVLRIEVAEDTALLNLKTDYPLENSGYNFTDVKQVYNLSKDPKKFKNIADSYNPGPEDKDGSNGPGEVNLTENVSAGEIVEMVMEYVPEVSVQTNSDFFELERLPAIVFEKVDSLKLRTGGTQELRNGSGSEVVRDMAAGVGFVQPPPKQSTFRFEFSLYSNSAGDSSRLSDAVDRWVKENQLLKRWALDDEVVLDQETTLDTNKETNRSDVIEVRGSWLIRGVPLYLYDVEEKPLVTQIVTETKLP